MRRVEAIVRPQSLEVVKAALADLGRGGVTVFGVTGHGVQGGVSQQWRGGTCTVDLLPKVSVVVVVQDNEVREVVESIVAAARTHRMGDGKIFVSPVEDVIRIRTGESGSSAL
jgi:nitrogen regulatory protein P-II 1